MSDGSSIDYVDATINPLGWGCLGPGGTAEKPARCPYCYGYRMAKRNLRDCPQCRAFVPHWHPEELDKLSHWTKPRRVFVESMGDLFDSCVTSYQRQAVMQSICEYGQHTYLMLTKEAESMAKRMVTWNTPPFPNLWLGTSITNQQDADERIPWLLKTPAAHRWLSVEPMQGPVGLLPWLPIVRGIGVKYRRRILNDRLEASPIQWIAIGAETGNRKGKVTPKREWLEAIVAQCEAGDVPVFLKSNLASVWGGELIQQYPEGWK